MGHYPGCQNPGGYDTRHGGLHRLIGYEYREVCQRLLFHHNLDFRIDTFDAGEIGGFIFALEQ
jgi:hypothetical protein